MRLGSRRFAKTCEDPCVLEYRRLVPNTTPSAEEEMQSLNEVSDTRGPEKEERQNLASRQSHLRARDRCNPKLRSSITKTRLRNTVGGDMCLPTCDVIY